MPEPSAREVAVEALTLTPAEDLHERMAELKAAAEEAGLSVDEVAAVLKARPELPRPLLPRERDTLVALLSHRDFPGRDQLLAQLDSTYVDGYCGCGCAAVGLRVQRDVAPSVCETLTPANAIVEDDSGEPIGTIHIFVRGGYLDEIGISWFDVPICPLPPLDRLRW